MSPFTGAVLTGGASRRMGEDKALLVVDGAPLAQRVLDALAAAGAAELLVIGGDESSLSRLDRLDRVVPDEHPGEGPLGGIITALRSAAHERVVVLACDTPGIDGRTPCELLGALIAVGADVAIAVVDGRRQPLTAAWSSDCLGRLEASFDEGIRAPRDAMDDLDVVEVHSIPATAVADLDRPDDLARYAARRVTQTTGDDR